MKREKMPLDWGKAILVILTVMLAFALGRALGVVQEVGEDCRYIMSGYDRINMYNRTYIPNLVTDGYYRENQFYCVWVEDETEEDINKTETHELCHHYVYMEREHFCKE